jgi:hypothetical protein
MVVIAILVYGLLRCNYFKNYNLQFKILFLFYIYHFYFTIFLRLPGGFYNITAYLYSGKTLVETQTINMTNVLG